MIQRYRIPLLALLLFAPQIFFAMDPSNSNDGDEEVYSSCRQSIGAGEKLLIILTFEKGLQCMNALAAQKKDQEKHTQKIAEKKEHAQ